MKYIGNFKRHWLNVHYRALLKIDLLNSGWGTIPTFFANPAHYFYDYASPNLDHSLLNIFYGLFMKLCIWQTTIIASNSFTCKWQKVWLLWWEVEKKISKTAPMKIRELEICLFFFLLLLDSANAETIYRGASRHHQINALSRSFQQT